MSFFKILPNLVLLVFGLALGAVGGVLAIGFLAEDNIADAVVWAVTGFAGAILGLLLVRLLVISTFRSIRPQELSHLVVQSFSLDETTKQSARVELEERLPSLLHAAFSMYSNIGLLLVAVGLIASVVGIASLSASFLQAERLKSQNTLISYQLQQDRRDVSRLELLRFMDTLLSETSRRDPIAAVGFGFWPTEVGDTQVCVSSMDYPNCIPKLDFPKYLMKDRTGSVILSHEYTSIDLALIHESMNFIKRLDQNLWLSLTLMEPYKEVQDPWNGTRKLSPERGLLLELLTTNGRRILYGHSKFLDAIPLDFSFSELRGRDISGKYAHYNIALHGADFRDTYVENPMVVYRSLAVARGADLEGMTVEFHPARWWLSKSSVEVRVSVPAVRALLNHIGGIESLVNLVTNGADEGNVDRNLAVSFFEEILGSHEEFLVSSVDRIPDSFKHGVYALSQLRTKDLLPFNKSTGNLFQNMANAVHEMSSLSSCWTCDANSIEPRKGRYICTFKRKDNSRAEDCSLSYGAIETRNGSDMSSIVSVDKSFRRTVIRSDGIGWSRRNNAFFEKLR